MVLPREAASHTRYAHDAHLVARAQAGDQGAFRQLFEAYSPLVYRLAYRMTGAPEDAADLTQEIFVRAYQRLGSLRDGQAFQAWIMRLATNMACDAARARKPQLLSLDAMTGDAEGEIGWEACDPGADSEAQVLSEEMSARVQVALASLSPEHRAVVVLHHLEGQSVEDIAATLRVAIGTVKSRLARARAELKRKLCGYVEG